MWLNLFVGNLLLPLCAYGLTFSSPKNFAKISIQRVTHIEEGFDDADEVILSSANALHSLQKGQHNAVIIAGGTRGYYAEGIGANARFNHISGFHQINGTYIIVVDRGSHCLRLINRDTKQTKSFAGQCESAGFSNGSSLEAAFRNPSNIISAQHTYAYYLADTGNNAIRLIQVSSDLQDVLTSTIYTRELLNRPAGLVLDGHQLLISTDTDIARLDLTSKDVKFFSLPELSGAENIVLVSKGVYLIADWRNKVIHRLDIDNSSLAPLQCGDDTTWDRIKPYSLCLSNKGDKLYIGTQAYSIECIEVGETDFVTKIPLESDVKSSTTKKSETKLASVTQAAATTDAPQPKANNSYSEPANIPSSHEITKMVDNSADQSTIVVVEPKPLSPKKEISTSLDNQESFSRITVITSISTPLVVVLILILATVGILVRNRRLKLKTSHSRRMERLSDVSSDDPFDDQSSDYERPPVVGNVPWTQPRSLPTPPDPNPYEIPVGYPNELPIGFPETVAPLPPSSGSSIDRPRNCFDNADDQCSPLMRRNTNYEYLNLPSQSLTRDYMSLNPDNK